MREIIGCFDPDTKITNSHNFDVVPQEMILKLRDNIEITIPIEGGDGDIWEITEFEKHGECNVPKRVSYKMRLEVESDSYKIVKYKE